MRASHGLKWEKKMYKLKRSILFMYHIMAFIALLQILLEVKEHQHVQSQTSVSYLEEKQRLFLLLYY